MKTIWLLFVFVGPCCLQANTQSRITSGITKNTYIADVDVNFQPKLKNIIGRNKLNLGPVKLDGKKNVFEVDTDWVSVAADLDEGQVSGSVHLVIFDIIGGYERNSNRNYVGIEGEMGPYKIRMELDFEPRMSATTGSVVINPENIPDTDYKLIITNETTAKKVYFEGTTKTDIETAKNGNTTKTSAAFTPSGTSDISLVFIIDSSGSMRENDPRNMRKTALKQMLALLAGNERFYLIDFDDRAKWLTRNNYIGWTPSDIIGGIKTIDAAGGTDVGIGLAEASNALITTSSNYEKTAVMLLTDGQGSYRNEVDWFVDQGIKVYTISYKQKADATLMSALAFTTGGIYIQADSEEDIVAAFLQFYNDLIGNGKYLSYKSTMNNQSVSVLPEFYTDAGSDMLLANINWTGTDKRLRFFTPSGQQFYNGNHGSEWKEGGNYAIIKVKDPEKGIWKAQVENKNKQPSDDQFIVEVSGKSPLNISLDDKALGRGFSFDLESDGAVVNWQKSNAVVNVTTPKGRQLDLSQNYNSGKLSFLPTDGKGSYTLELLVKASDPTGSPFQRQFVRSVLAGDAVQGYISSVSRVMGQFIYSDQGSAVGNYPGMKCYLYKMGGSKQEAIAEGYVTNVRANECTIKIQHLIGASSIAPNDIIELDFIQWMGD